MTKILILGSALWQVPYLQKAKEMGLFVCATDWSNLAEGKEYADVFVPIDVRDKQKSLEFAMANSIDAIFTSSDVGVPTAAYVAEKLNLPYHSQELANIATNKFLMRNALRKGGLRVPQYCQCSSKKDVLSQINLFSFPVIVKPVDNCGSRGVFVINSISELEKEIKVSFENSFSGNILIEELMRGQESSVEVLVDNSKPYILGWCKKRKSEFPYRFDLQLDYFPNKTKEEDTEVETMVSALVSALKVKNGILHIEFIWTAEGVKIIEFALRGCGSDVITHLMPVLRNYDTRKFLLNKAMGIETPITLSKSKYGTLKFIVPKEGKVKSVSGIETIKKFDFVVDFHCDLQNGFEIGTIMNARNRPGHYIVVGDSEADILQKIQRIDNTLKIEYYD